MDARSTHFIRTEKIIPTRAWWGEIPESMAGPVCRVLGGRVTVFFALHQCESRVLHVTGEYAYGQIKIYLYAYCYNFICWSKSLMKIQGLF